MYWCDFHLYGHDYDSINDEISILLYVYVMIVCLCSECREHWVSQLYSYVATTIQLPWGSFLPTEMQWTKRWSVLVGEISLGACLEAAFWHALPFSCSIGSMLVFINASGMITSSSLLPLTTTVLPPYGHQFQFIPSHYYSLTTIWSPVPVYSLSLLQSYHHMVTSSSLLPLTTTVLPPHGHQFQFTPSHYYSLTTTW